MPHWLQNSCPSTPQGRSCRRSTSGALERQESLLQLMQALAPDYHGGLRIATGSTLMWLDHKGTEPCRCTPFARSWLAELWRDFPFSSSPLLVLVASPLDGTAWAASHVPAEAAAFGLRDVLWNLDVIGQWTDPAEADPPMPWVRECWKALDAHAMGGVYVNHLGADEPECVRDAYGHNYARLVQVKQQYDPRNVFRCNQNIRPIA